MKHVKNILAYSHLGNKRTWWLEEKAALSFEAMRNHWQDIYGCKFRISDAGRTYEQQQALKIAKPNLAAAPGKSWHEAGLAIDVDVSYLKEQSGMTQNELEYWMKQYGWKRTVKNENWHFEYHLDIPRNDVAAAIGYIENGEEN